MPILDIRGLAPKPGIELNEVLVRTCHEVAQAFECPPSQVIATWQTIESGHYAEGKSAALNQPNDTHPVIVYMKVFEGLPQEKIEQGIKATADILAEQLQLPNNIFIIFEEAKSGWVFDGKSIVKN